MRARSTVTLVLAAGISALLCGCGERPRGANHSPDAHPVVEGDVAAPGSVDVAAGRPQGLPEDIPIPDGLRATSVNELQPGSVVAVLTGELDPDDVARNFADSMRDQGWAIDESRAHGNDLGLFAHKNERIASVVVTRLDGKLHVELGVWSPE
jgi:hypothetical protein